MAGLNKNPDLIEPVDLVVETINKVQTPYSTGVSGKREIINHVVRDQFTIPAQVVFANLDQDMQTTQLGASEKAKGYVILKRGDLKAQGKQINRGATALCKFTVSRSNNFFISYIALGIYLPTFQTQDFHLLEFSFPTGSQLDNGIN
jgi:hypothetical protein